MYLQRKGILHARRMCARDHEMMLSFERGRWRCSKRECREEKGVRTGTWLEGSKLPIKKAVLFIYCWAHELSSVKFCERELDVGPHAVVDWSNYLREVCAAHLLQHPTVIGGPGMTVEIDESLFVRRKNHHGRVLPQQWIFGGICRETGENFAFCVPDRSSDTLLPIIRQSIRPGSLIVSDEWQGYNHVRQHFNHDTVNHSYYFIDPATGAHTQNVERMWRTAKERNKRQSGTARHMLDSYMCEYMWRSRLHARDPFETVLQHIVDFWPPA